MDIDNKNYTDISLVTGIEITILLGFCFLVSVILFCFCLLKVLFK